MKSKDGDHLTGDPKDLGKTVPNLWLPYSFAFAFVCLCIWYLNSDKSLQCHDGSRLVNESSEIVHSRGGFIWIKLQNTP